MTNYLGIETIGHYREHSELFRRNWYVVADTNYR